MTGRLLGGCHQGRTGNHSGDEQGGLHASQ
jgi:hypothetical protein